MRRTVIAALAAGLGLLSGCFKDEGNYDYKEPLSIRVENVAASYVVMPGVDRLRITPKIYPEDRTYDCFWTATAIGTAWTADTDTLSYGRDLDYPVTLNLGTYKLRFCAKDRATGIFSYTEYNLQVTTDMSSGWWILKSEGDSADVDFFSDKKVKRDLVKTINGTRLAGEAVGLNFTPYYWDFDAKTKQDRRTEAVFLAAKNDLVVVDYFTGRILRNYDELFIDRPVRREVKSIFRGPSDTHVDVGGNVYTMYHSSEDVFNRFLVKVGGQYDLSAWHHGAGSLPLLFNTINSSFCSLQRTSTTLEYFRDGIPASKNTGMDLMYLGGLTTEVGAQGNEALAVMKVRGADKYYLYTLNGQPYETDSNPVVKAEELYSGLGLMTADNMALNQNNRIIYYSKNDRLYACNLDNQEETLQTVQIGEGEHVTYMEFVKFSPYGENNLWFDYMAVATVKNNRYKLSLHPVAAGTLMPAVKVFEGKGSVKRICYLHQSVNGILMSPLF